MAATTVVPEQIRRLFVADERREAADGDGAGERDGVHLAVEQHAIDALRGGRVRRVGLGAVRDDVRHGRAAARQRVRHDVALVFGPDDEHRSAVDGRVRGHGVGDALHAQFRNPRRPA